MDRRSLLQRLGDVFSLRPPQCFSRCLACNRRVQPPGLGGPLARVLTDNFAAHPLRVMPPGLLRCTIGLHRADMLRPEGLVVSGGGVVRSNARRSRGWPSRSRNVIDDIWGCECSRPHGRPRWLGHRGMGWCLIAHRRIRLPYGSGTRFRARIVRLMPPSRPKLRWPAPIY